MRDGFRAYPMMREPKTVPIPAPDPATPTVAAPAPMNLAAVSISRAWAETASGLKTSQILVRCQSAEIEDGNASILERQNRNFNYKKRNLSRRFPKCERDRCTHSISGEIIVHYSVVKSGQDFYSGALNLNRFLWTRFFQSRNSDR